jgi:methylated-DNA-protein-cysteine methyltransferase-like protein
MNNFPAVKRTMRSEKAALPNRLRISACIARIPRGMVSTYGAVGRAAGIGRGARQVAAFLRRSGGGLPWHRVLGAGGQIKLQGNAAFEQRFRLEAEGVRFRGKRVDMANHEFKFAKMVRARTR